VELITAWDLLRMMPSLGGVPPGVAHELNQPLNAIKMGSEFIKIMLRQGEKVREEDLSEVANEISKQADRASEIIYRLSDVWKQEDFAREKVNINTPINETLAIIENQLYLENIRLEMDLGENISPILAHSARLRQVVYNLVMNASDAIRAKGNDEEDNASRIIRICTFQDRGKVVMSVFDSGIGIPSHLKERIFEPFYSTKESGKGKGLGLPITHEIVGDYNGRIMVETKKGTGTTFKIYFPAL